MSKNISVKIDGVATSLSVDKLRTGKDGGGTVDWIPEENMSVSSLKVHRNGTYTAEAMGVPGFDVVKVAIDNHGGAGAALDGSPHVGDLVTHNPAIQEGEQARTMGGAKRLKLNKPGGGAQMFVADVDIQTGTLTATQNGTFRARSDGKYSYTSVTVNVSSGGGGGGGGGGDDPYAPENLPKYIAGLPWKMDYMDGEPIVIQDGEIKAYKEVVAHEGQNVLWTSPEYPNGGIPRNELNVSPTVAKYEDESPAGDIYSAQSGLVFPPFNCGHAAYLEYVGNDLLVSFVSGTGMMTGCYLENQTGASILFASSNPNALIHDFIDRGLTNQYTYDNKTVYYDITGFRGHVEHLVPNTGIGFPADVGKMAWTMIYGTVMHLPSTQYETVKWQRPVDGVELTHMFGVFVEKEAT